MRYWGKVIALSAGFAFSDEGVRAVETFKSCAQLQLLFIYRLHPRDALRRFGLFPYSGIGSPDPYFEWLSMDQVQELLTKNNKKG